MSDDQSTRTMDRSTRSLGFRAYRVVVSKKPINNNNNNTLQLLYARIILPIVRHRVLYYIDPNDGYVKTVGGGGGGMYI